MTTKVTRAWLSIIGLGFIVSAIISYCHDNTMPFIQALVTGLVFWLIALVIKRPVWAIIIGSAGAIFLILTMILGK